MFTDIGRTVDYQRYQDAVSNNGNLSAPNVPVHCFYGDIQSSTPKVFYYGSNFPQSFMTYVNGSGDTTVNLEDSELCLQWKDQQTASFSSQTFPVTHLAMVADQTVLDAINAVITTSLSDNDPQDDTGSDDTENELEPVQHYFPFHI